MKNHHHNNPIHPRPAPPTHEDIATCAYTLWTEQGRPEDRAELIWLEAEQQLSAKKL